MSMFLCVCLFFVSSFVCWFVSLSVSSSDKDDGDDNDDADDASGMNDMVTLVRMVLR